MNQERQQTGLDNRPQTAFQMSRHNKNQSANKLPQVDDKRVQSAGYNQQSCHSQKSNVLNTKSINPVYQELGFVAPQSAKSVNQAQKFQSTQGQEILQKDYKRIIPRSMIHDKEKLYEDLIKNKQLVNHLQEDNFKLRTRVAFQEEEIQRNGQPKQEYDDILTSSINQGPMGKSQSQALLGSQSAQFQKQQPQQVELSLIPNLKKQVKDLNFELKQKDKELQAIKRNVKLTKLSELEVELKSYEDETIRLKHLLQQSLQVQNESNEEDNNMEERYIQSLNQNKGLQKQISELEQEIQLFQDQLQAQEVKYKEIERLNYRLTKEKTKLKQQLVQKEKDLDRYRMQDPLAQQTVKKGTTLGTSEGQLKNELEKKIIQCNEAVTELISTKKNFEDHKKKTDLLDYEQQQTIKNQNDKIQEQKEKIETDAKAYAELKDKYEKIINISNKKERKTNEKSQKPNNNSLQPTPFVDIQQQLSEVQNLVGHELKYKLQVGKIDPLTVGQYLFTQEAQTTNIVSYKELVNTLQNQPFELSNGNKLQTLVKYLMQEPEDPKTIDENTKSTMQNIKKNFMDVVLNYKKLRRDEEKAIVRQVYPIIKENKQNIKGQIQQIQKEKFGNVDSLQCTRETFLQSLKNVGFEPNAQDYIMGKVYEETKNCESINIDFFFNLFSMENAPQMGRDSILARRQSQLYQKGVISARPSQFTPLKTTSGKGTNTNKNSNTENVESFTHATEKPQKQQEVIQEQEQETKENQIDLQQLKNQSEQEQQQEKQRQEQKRLYEEEQEKIKQQQMQKIKEEQQKQQEEQLKKQKEEEELKKKQQQQQQQEEEEKQKKIKQQQEEEEKQRKLQEEQEQLKKKQEEEEQKKIEQQQKQKEIEDNLNDEIGTITVDRHKKDDNVISSNLKNQLQSQKSEEDQDKKQDQKQQNQQNQEVEEEYQDNFQDDFESLDINQTNSQAVGQSIKDQINKEQQKEIKEEEYENSDDNNKNNEYQQQSEPKIQEELGTSDLGTDPQYKQEKSKTQTQTNTNDKQLVMEEVLEEPDVIEL